MLTPIVGSHFRPPAKLLLSILPAGTPLHLDPEPDNPYDPDAIRVVVRPSEVYIPMESLDAIEDEILSCGHTIAGIVASNSIHLGYVPSSQNPKSCRGYPGNSEVLGHLTPDHYCQLTFAPDGTPLIAIYQREALP